MPRGMATLVDLQYCTAVTRLSRDIFQHLRMTTVFLERHLGRYKETLRSVCFLHVYCRRIHSPC